MMKHLLVILELKKLLGDTYLRFIPLPDAYNTDYDIKVVRTQFNQQAGVGTFGGRIC